MVTASSIDNSSPSANITDPKQAHVLVVEDNLQNLVLMARLLAFIGVQTYEWKASGWQVVEFALTMPRVDLILMDIHLPHENGFEALQNLRAEPRFIHTKIVAVTADTTQSTMERVRTAGFNGFLGKPIDPDKFPDQIAAILRGEPVWNLGTFD